MKIASNFTKRGIDKYPYRGIWMHGSPIFVICTYFPNAPDGTFFEPSIGTINNKKSCMPIEWETNTVIVNHELARNWLKSISNITWISLANSIV